MPTKGSIHCYDLMLLSFQDDKSLTQANQINYGDNYYLSRTVSTFLYREAISSELTPRTKRFSKTSKETSIVGMQQQDEFKLKIYQNRRTGAASTPDPQHIHGQIELTGLASP
ncbi:hypothetical protein U9M48_038019 [Paspalum notatum var. saurae]|uniref:Uncharacterized protein n=1 Tax=Paspalum notatum var. saurae TaxID=547442 RepID=A0AAQ3UG50_PASNO